jgi:hypothetical protein
MAPTTRSKAGAAPKKGNAGGRTTTAAPKKGSAGGRTAAAAATTKKGAVEGSSMSTTTHFQLLIYQPRTLLIFLLPLEPKRTYTPAQQVGRDLSGMCNISVRLFGQSSFTRSHSCTFASDTVLLPSFNPLFCLNKQRPSILSTLLFLYFRLLYPVLDVVSSSSFSL